MAFHFGEIEGDVSDVKVHLRDINSRARQWDHPVKGLFKYASAMTKHGGDILKLSKNERELYCISLVGLALKNDNQLDWWTHIPAQDPPDGIVMTLMQKTSHAYMGYMREVEVVEHRDEPNMIFDVIKEKMTTKAYAKNTILVCLALTPGAYDFKMLAEKLAPIKSSLKHVFVVFSGIPLSQNLPAANQLRTTSTMVQVLPVFEQTTLDLQPHMDDFKERYDKGQESRLIEANAVYYGTANPIYSKKPL